MGKTRLVHGPLLGYLVANMKPSLLPIAALSLLPAILLGAPEKLFNGKDLSGWKVSKIASEPQSFDDGADAWLPTDAGRPVLGVHPHPSVQR